MQTANREFMREWNRKLVLRQIRAEKETSQISLVRKTRLSAGTIVNITKELRDDGFIRYTGKGKSQSGRKPENFCFNPNARYIISAVMFALETKLSIVNLGGTILHKISHQSEHVLGEKDAFKRLAKQVKGMLRKYSIPKEKVSALCVNIEGIVDPDAGSLKLSTHFGWENVPVRDILEKSLGLKTFIESEGRAMALGEYWYGAGKQAKSMLCVDIDSGIGMSFINDGNVYHGIHHMEGEVGHISVLPEGPLCRCGRNGCLEVVSSGSAIIKKAAELAAFGDRRRGSTAKIGDLPERTAIRTVFKMAERNNPGFLKILNDAGRHIGSSIAGIVTYADPELVVLTGYVPEEDPGIFLSIIDRAYRDKVFAPDMRKTIIVKGALGEDSALIGGATLAYKEMFEGTGG